MSDVTSVSSLFGTVRVERVLRLMYKWYAGLRHLGAYLPGYKKTPLTVGFALIGLYARGIGPIHTKV